MREVFADTGYWIALTNRKDRYHQVALEVSRQIAPCRIHTSEMVLAEFLNFMSAHGPALRAATVNMVDRIRRNPNIRLAPQTSQLFGRALELYRNRPDKTYSLTDCSEMVLMDEQGLSEVLSSDRHFEQHGLRILLKLAE
jgi:predicted nucleic acid-binding protein